MTIRNGIFIIDVAAMSSETRRLIYHGEGAIYRFFNSTDRASPLKKKIKIQNTYDSGPEEVDQILYPTMCIDVAVGPTSDASMFLEGIEVQAENKTSANEDMKGIWELVRDTDGTVLNNDRKSGRFNFPRSIADTHLPVMIADLTFSSDDAIYRVFNTGKHTFELFVAEDKNKTNEVLSTDVFPRQAIDITIDDMDSRKVFVTRKASLQPIKGIFELVR
ncbi:hypothetical protein KOR42_12120 [Thalassoglobus neptunius]|uniref:Uncharacterized protein n=1 Tax=Thalassoglobus neptunius TaxID=1938619 RepID=A0A5C5X6S4_9PLAN|nr:hypothetical protein [Thalassoglobus neptunius]TWT57845.1 hypothetical protein KOR42_12120 [Thalassoglobus neptunius]